MPRPLDAPAGVVDCARWLSERARPEVGLPTVDYPATSRADAGWRVRVALLGAPVDTDHPDLVGARTTTWDGTRPPGPATPDGPGAAGTAHAALLVGQGRSQVHGLVPAAHLLLAPVLAGWGTGLGVPHTDEVVARAVRWAVGEGAQVIVLPFGRRRLGRRLAVTLRRATAAGAIVFAAAGDHGPRSASFPGSVTGVTAVTGYDDDGVLPQCSRLADLAAPARDVPGAGPDGVRPLEGSEVAAVLAAGAHAAALSELMLEVYGAVHGAPDGWASLPPAAGPHGTDAPSTSRHRRDERRHRHGLVHV